MTDRLETDNNGRQVGLSRLLKYRTNKRAVELRPPHRFPVPGLKISQLEGLSPRNLAEASDRTIHIRSSLNGSTQEPWPKDISDFRADLALWLYFRFQRKEAVSLVVLLMVEPVTAKRCKSVPYLVDVPEFCR